jgi:anti-sigma regulatory factor (Ser/Thr protein kinase)
VDGGGICLAEISGGRLDLFLNNNLTALEDGRRRVLEHFEPAKLSPRAINRLEVILEEVVTNIIRHGLTEKSDQLILVSASVSLDAISLVFEDEGTPFNPLDAPPPEPFEKLETAKIGGLGIHLVTRLSKSARYDRIPQGQESRMVGNRRFRPINRLSLSIAS